MVGSRQPVGFKFSIRFFSIRFFKSDRLLALSVPDDRGALRGVVSAWIKTGILRFQLNLAIDNFSIK